MDIADMDWEKLLLCARIVVNGVKLFLQAFGISLSISTSAMENAIKKTAIVLRESSVFQHAVKLFLIAWKGAGDSNVKRAKAIFALVYATNAAGFLWVIITILFSSLSKWAWVKISAKLSAMILATFASSGFAVIGNMALPLLGAVDFIMDVNTLLDLN